MLARLTAGSAVVPSRQVLAFFVYRAFASLNVSFGVVFTAFIGHLWPVFL
jgi:glycerol-3-phosphate acyltransferase PlsY